MSEQLITELTANLEMQRELYDMILVVAKDKKSVLVKGDLAGLDECTRQEEKLVVQVGKLEEERIRIHQALANHFHVQPQEVTIAFLLEKCGQTLSDSFSREAIALRKTLDSLQEVNSLNSDLVKQSLNYIEYARHLVT